jgi:PAS domain S-box-containing protein
MTKDIDGFFRLLVEGIPEAIIVSKPDGTIVYFNPAAERLTGYSAADVEGQDITMLLPRREDRRADPLKWLQRWAAEPYDVQSRFLDLIGRTKDGKDVPFGVRVRSQQIDGQDLYLITFRDVSVRKAEQASFRESHLRATRILQIAEDAIISIDQNQEITFFNLTAEKVFGFSAEEVIGQPLTMLLPKPSRDTHEGHVKAFGQSKTPSKMMSERGEVTGLRKNGEIFPIEASITSVHVHGEPTFTAHIRDITKQKQAQAALIESELRFRAIFDNAYEAMALLSPDGKVLEANRAGKALTEGDAPLTGIALWELPWFTDDADPQGEREGREQLRQAVAAGAQGEVTHFATLMTKPGGKAHTIDFNLIPVKDTAGEVVFLVAEGRDITART